MKYELETTNCNLCGSRDYEVCLKNVKELYVGLDEFFDVVQCKKCGFKFTNPRPTQATMNYFYPDISGYYTPTETDDKRPDTFRKKIYKGILKNHYGYPFAANVPAVLTYPIYLLFWRKISMRFLPRYVKGGKLLDIGCSWGGYLSKMKELGWDTYGVEMNSKIVDYAKENLGLQNIYNGLIEEIEFDRKYFSAVNMSMILEHTYNPLGVLRKVNYIMKNNGQLIITTPDISGFEANTFKDKFYGIQVPQHLNHFTPNTIKLVLSKAGFKIEKMIHHNFDRDIVGSLSYSRNKRFFRFVSNKIVRKTLVNLFVNFLSLIGKSSRITVYARKIRDI